MTICASVKVRDGLVLGTDSMTQIWGQDQAGTRLPIKHYANARKLFKIDDKVAVMTYGLGNLGPRSIYGFVREFKSEFTGEKDIKSVAEGLYEHINRPYRDYFGNTAEPNPTLGFYVAGYSPDGEFPEEWEFMLPRDNEVQTVRPAELFGASWRGVSIPFTRLYKGYDPRLPQKLEQMDLSPEIQQALQEYESPVVYDGMPVQDAVNFAVFILKTTIGMSTFELGTPSCGGPLQIATILPETGFEWIQEPKIEITE